MIVSQDGHQTPLEWHLPILEQPIRLYTTPWVMGTRAAGYFGPVMLERMLLRGSDLDLGFWQALTDLALAGEKLGADAVVGLQIDLDPFAVVMGLKGVRISLEGTAAKLEALRG